MSTQISGSPAVCDKINEASLAYAAALNDDLSTYMRRLVASFDLPAKSYSIAPYTYFYYDGYDVDIGNEMVPHAYGGKEYISIYSQDDEDHELAAETYRAVLQHHAKGSSRSQLILGLVGITMAAAGDTDDNSAHYVSYVFRRGTKSVPASLAMFDSGGWNKGEIYYHMIKDAFGVPESQISLNSGVFEKDGGESKSEYTYVGQNIFCHTWSLWFWNQHVGNKLSMSEISALAGKKTLKNQQNLIRIKNYIYNELVPTINLKFLSKEDEEVFIRNFPYIFLNKEMSRRRVIFPSQ